MRVDLKKIYADITNMFFIEDIEQPIGLLSRVEKLCYIQKSLFPNEELNSKELFLVIACNYLKAKSLNYELRIMTIPCREIQLKFKKLNNQLIKINHKRNALLKGWKADSDYKMFTFKEDEE
jgi:hypothetical protein